MPCVSTVPFDGGDFRTYGERRGQNWLVFQGQQRNRLDIQVRLEQEPPPTREQEDLFQTWFFFGLLQTILGPSYKLGDWIGEADAERWVSTQPLMQHLERTLRFSDRKHLSAKKQTLARTAECLRLIAVLLPTARPDFEWRVRTSIASVCELFANAVITAHRALDLDSSYLPHLSNHYAAGFEAHVKDDMLKAGWCPSEIAAMTAKFVSVQTLWLLSRIDKSNLARDHSSCTTRMCRYYQIDPATYQSKHREAGCKCKDTGVDEEAVRRIIQAGNLPLLKITGSVETLGIEVVESTPMTKYVALSNVWADGRGNPNANSLPACQLAFLGQLARDLGIRLKNLAAAEDKWRQEQLSANKSLLASLSSWFRKPPPSVPVEDPAPAHVGEPNSESEPILIWLDTLCCPISPPKIKKLAVSQEALIRIPVSIFALFITKFSQTCIFSSPLFIGLPNRPVLVKLFE